MARPLEILSVEEVARLLGRTEHAVYVAAHKGQLPVRRWGRRLLFVRGEIEEFIAGLPRSGPASPTAG